MFVPKNIKRLQGWHKKCDFDAVLLSAGGNDFVANFLRDQFKDEKVEMSARQAFLRIKTSGRFEKVRDAYVLFVGTLLRQKPQVPIISHSYDYPRLMGQRAEFTLGNLGAAAILAKGAGPWIGDRISHVIRDPREQRVFARMMIDGFVELVLLPTKEHFAKEGVFDFADFRGTLKEDSWWFDEMHPTGGGFQRLAEELRTLVISYLPDEKKGY